MSRILALTAALTLASPAVPALAQDARGGGVEVAQLAAPDAFSTPGRDTGLPPDLWRGASPDVLAAVLPRLAQKTLSGAAAALARRVLATGATGPQGLGADPSALANRAAALNALGDPRAAAAVLNRAPGLDRSSELSRAAAESALLAGDDARACAVAETLTVGREEIYWLRLRAYCQAVAGKTSQAQLTYQLAQTQALDPVFGRLMGAKLAGGGGDIGSASLRNGLDYALSRSLGLDLGTAKPSPQVAAALAGAEPTEPSWTVPDGDSDRLAAARALASGQDVPGDLVARLLDAAVMADVVGRASTQAAALIVVGWTGAPGPDLSGRLAALSVAEGKAPAGRNFVLSGAAREKQMGQVAMLSLWTCLDVGDAGLAPADRARITQALRQVGLERDARNFAVEGLLAAP